MKYYRVKKEFDNYDRKDGSILVKNELYTEREVNKFEIPMERLTEVSVSQRDVYWMFGARFCKQCGWSGQSDV